MAKAQMINEAFLTAKGKMDIEVKKATLRNISRITDSDTKEIHENLMKVLNVKSSADSSYYELASYKELIAKVRRDVAKRLKAKEEKEAEKNKHK